jgi:Nif-specific regulatory protein
LEFALAVAETLAVALENLAQRRRLTDDLDHARGENEQLREQLGTQSEIVGRSPIMARVRSQIARVAASNATVLVCGESGVGKELVARALHASSARRDRLFVCLNCAALTESLLESELFGHERGAFTGASDRKIGKFEAADGGTIFLDEIGEMSPHLQAKFLRVLEGHPFERVGGSEPVSVDVRVIAATNRDLEKEVEKNHFRRDLYFRLRVVEIVVPGLRKRPDDIPILANHFLDRFTRETGRRIRGFTPEAMEQMRRYRWPGNVREMKNVIERAVVLCEGQQIDVGDLMLSKLATSGETNEASVPLDEFTPLTLEELERRHIRATLVATGWNKSQTAQILGIERSTLDRKIRRYGLNRDLKLPR